MKRKLIFTLLMAVLLSFTGCSGGSNSLGKTNNTAVAIAGAMKDYLKDRGKEDLALYGIELILNSDGNGTVKLYYTGDTPAKASYSDVYVSEVDSKTGHVERFGKADYGKDGITPYKMVRECRAFDAASLPIDSSAAVTAGMRAFSGDVEFYYDYVQVALSAPGATERYEIRYISMLNDMIYYCTVDAVTGAVLTSSVGVL